MSTLNATLPGLYDLTQMDRPDGNGMLTMIRSMTEQQDMLKDMPFFQANDRQSHKYLRNTNLVSGTWVKLNDGISASKGANITDTAVLGRIESRLIVDMRFADIEPDFEAYVERLAIPHYEGLANDVGDAIANGTIAGGYAFPSIEEHIASASQTDQFGQKMFHTYGGSATLTSIIAIQWGQDQVYGVYPKGHKYTGVERRELGRDQLTTGNNSSQMRSYVCDFAWQLGLVIADDRCVRRIGNIEPVGASNNMEDSSFKVTPIINALVAMKDMGRGAVLYMNRSVWAHFWIAAKGDSTVNYTAQNPWDQPEYYFSGHKIRFTDSLLNTESQVT
ncbi:MAG: major capsid protein [bacterium]